MKNAILGLFAALLAGCAGLQEAGTTGGFSQQRLDAMSAQVKADVARGRIPGAVLLLSRNGQVGHFEAIGVRDPTTGAPLQRDDIFRIYSMTKPIVSVGVMILAEEGKLVIGDPVAKYLPELKGLRVGVEKRDAAGKPVLETVAATRQPTIQDLLRHTSGLTYGVFGKSMVKDRYNAVDALGRNQTNAEMIAKLGKLPLALQPGTAWEYSMSTDVLGALIERVSGQALGAFLQARILGPLGMKDTAFSVPAQHHGRIAEAFAVDPDTKAKVSLYDVRQPPRFESGGGGLVSTAEDYLRFAQMLLNGGELGGARILSKQTVDYMTADHLGGIRGPTAGYGFGLGFTVRLADGVADTPGSKGDYNWGGLGGTYFWIDPKEKLVAIWMMQAPGPRGYYRAFYRTTTYGALRP